MPDLADRCRQSGLRGSPAIRRVASGCPFPTGWHPTPYASYARTLMRSNAKRLLAAVVLLISCASADAQDRAEYNRRGVARYLELFQSLDRDGDGAVTRSEAHGDLNFTPSFNDMDINRDGI